MKKARLEVNKAIKAATGPNRMTDEMKEFIVERCHQTQDALRVLEDAVNEKPTED